MRAARPIAGPRWRRTRSSKAFWSPSFALVTSRSSVSCPCGVSVDALFIVCPVYTRRGTRVLRTVFPGSVESSSIVWSDGVRDREIRKAAHRGTQPARGRLPELAARMGEPLRPPATATIQRELSPLLRSRRAPRTPHAGRDGARPLCGGGGEGGAAGGGLFPRGRGGAPWAR